MENGKDKKHGSKLSVIRVDCVSSGIRLGQDLGHKNEKERRISIWQILKKWELTEFDNWTRVDSEFTIWMIGDRNNIFLAIIFLSGRNNEVFFF